MLLRLSLVIAIIAAIAVGVINFVMVKEKITTLITERDDWHGKFDKSQTDLAKTTKDLEKTTAELNTTKEALATTTAERDKAQADVASLTKKAADLAEKLSKTTQERDDAQANLAAYRATGLTPAQILGFNDQIKKLQEAIEVLNVEKKLLAIRLEKTEAKLAKYEGNWRPPILPAGLKGKILVSDPKWNFVVVDVGEDQGVKVDGEMLVNRNGRLVGKVQVLSVEKDRCIANLAPGFQLGEILEGDTVVSDQPAS